MRAILAEFIFSSSKIVLSVTDTVGAHQIVFLNPNAHFRFTNHTRFFSLAFFDSFSCEIQVWMLNLARSLMQPIL